jgi:hypothetical protein
MRGNTGRPFGIINQSSTDPALRAILGSQGETIGRDVIQVGNRFVAANFAGEGTEILGEVGGTRTALWGYFKRRAQAVQKAETARGRGGTRSFRQFLLGDLDPESKISEGLSVLTKFGPKSSWAPRFFRRLLTEDVSEKELRSAAHFLTAQRFSPKLQEALSKQGARLFPEKYQSLVEHLGSDEAVLGFFRTAAEDRAFQATGNRLSSLVGQFRNSPASVLGRVEKGHAGGFLGFNVLGRERDLRGIDLMRRAILDEIEEGLSFGEERGFLDWVNRQKLGSKERESLLAWGHGKILQRRLEGEEGGVARAAAWFRGSREAQESIEAFTARRTRAWHAYVPEEGHSFGADRLIARHAISPREMLTEFNTRRKQGEGFLQSLGNTIYKRRPEGPLDPSKNYGFHPFLSQLGAFFTGNQKDATNATVALEYFPRKLEEYFRTMGLGLPDEDLLSGGSIMANLFAKRIIPAVAGVELYRYADYKGRQIGTGGPSDAYANLRGHAAIARAKILGEKIPLLGRRELFPGLEKFLPSRDEQEERRFQEEGFEPVRKGRFWAVGSRSEFWGEKIDYWLPNATRVARSNWQAAENADLNTSDYWAHSLIPLPENHFLGPLRALLSRRSNYWYEEKHAQDRPSLISGEFFDPNTPHGPLLNATLGRLLKPRRVLHPDDVPERLGGSASKEDLRRINQAMKQGLDRRGIALLVGSGPGGGGIGNVSNLKLGSPGVIGGGEFAGSLAVINAGGTLRPSQLPGDLTPSEWQSLGQSSIQHEGHGTRLSHREIARINRMTKAGAGGLVPMKPVSALRAATQTDPFSDEEMDLLDYESGTIAGLRNLSDIAGLYGWMARSALEALGHPLKERGVKIASSQRAYGFSRRFWDLALGGQGSELSEVSRRFLVRPEKNDIWNPLPNQMPSWLPGPEYQIQDFQHGDPFVKIPRGEIRLPGEAYESLHPELKLMQARASSLGHSTAELMREMLFLEQPMSAYGEEVSELGTRIHRAIQARWKRMGILAGAEFRLYDPELGISGHPDAVLRTQQGLEIFDIKTVGEKRYQESLRHPLAGHAEQVNFYLHETNLKSGGLLYVNRDDPDQMHLTPVRYSPGMLNRSVAKVREARSQLESLTRQGVISRGDLYDPVSRMEILGDVAPFSANYAQLREYLTEKNKAGDLSEDENARFQATKRRVAAQNKRVEVYPYRFREQDLDYQTVTVQKILDPNTIQVRGSDHPLRLAGLRSSQDRIEQAFGPAPEGMSLAEWQFRQFGIHPGSRVKVALEGDPERRIADDTLKTQHAVLFGKGGNVNRQLIEAGVGTEKETDYSDTGVAARFSPAEIWKGALWERFSHLDTPLHNKFLRVRSPLEQLERGIVFGKDTGGWTHPISDYLSPTLTSYAARNPLLAGLGVGSFASFFFRTKQAKAWAFGVGGALGATTSLLRGIQEQISGETWKPIRTRRREELEEYWDTLKYVKLRRLAAVEEDLAKKEEGIDVERMERDLFAQGESRKRRQNWLKRQKRDLKLGRALPELSDGERRDAVSEVQQALEQTEGQKGLLKLGPHATRALQYRELYRSTLYGFNPGETPFLNLFRALPKYKRELIQPFIEQSNARERKRIFELLPRAEQRVLGGYLGIDERRIPDRPTLGEYFKRHPLPDSSWQGWDEGVDLEQLRLMALKGEHLDPMESGIFPVQIEDAESRYGDVPVPTMRGSAPDIQSRLNTILSGKGVRNLNVRVDVQPHDGEEDDLQIQIDLKQRREREILDHLQLRGL